MMRIWITLALALLLAYPAFAEPINDVDQQIVNDVDDGRGVATDNSSEIIGTKATGFSAAAGHGSSAAVDNRFVLNDSALSLTFLDGTVSGNAVNMQGADFVGINAIDDGAFNETRGVTQASQNSGQNSLIQQSFTIEGNIKVDHHSP